MKGVDINGMIRKGKRKPDDGEWDEFWKQERSMGGMLSFMRRNVVAREVAHYCNRYFTRDGAYVECGCGSGESSVLLKAQGRTLIGLDSSSLALQRAKRVGAFDCYVEGNILDLPFNDGTLDGIWNVGVMEHFSQSELVTALSEFRRVLKKDSCAVMIWPYKYGPFSVAYEVASTVMKAFGASSFYPDGPSTIRNTGYVKEALEKSKLKPVRIELSPYMLFSNYIVVAKR